MIKWPKCKDNGGPKECLGHIEQTSDGRLYCDECKNEFEIKLKHRQVCRTSFVCSGKNKNLSNEVGEIKQVIEPTPIETQNPNCSDIYDRLERLEEKIGI